MIIFSLNRNRRPEEVPIHIYDYPFNIIEGPSRSHYESMVAEGKRATLTKKIATKTIAARMDDDDAVSTFLEIACVAKSNGIKNICVPCTSRDVYLLPMIRIALSDVYSEINIRIIACDLKNAISETTTGKVDEFLKYNYIHDSGIRYSINMDEESIREIQERRKAKQDSYLSTVDTSNIGKTSVDELINRLEEEGIELSKPFQKLLFEYIDRKGIDDVDVYKRANLDKRLFSKIRSDEAYRPSKPTVLSLCISLRLTVEETDELLNSAGFSLSRADMGDMIVQAFIDSGIYDIDELNLYLLNKNIKPLSYYG